MEKNGIGFSIGSLKELEEKLHSLSEEAYKEMQEKVQKINQELAGGHYIRTAISKALTSV